MGLEMSSKLSNDPFFFLERNKYQIDHLWVGDTTEQLELYFLILTSFMGPVFWWHQLFILNLFQLLLLICLHHTAGEDVHEMSVCWKGGYKGAILLLASICKTYDYVE